MLFVFVGFLNSTLIPTYRSHPRASNNIGGEMDKGGDTPDEQTL